MKLLNYDKRTLILQNLQMAERKEPIKYTQRQYKILCNLIRQKHISKQFFELILRELYGLSDWHKLDYKQMYELIHILTFYDYTKVRNL